MRGKFPTNECLQTSKGAIYSENLIINILHSPHLRGEKPANLHFIKFLGADHMIPEGGAMVFCKKKFVQQKMKNK